MVAVDFYTCQIETRHARDMVPESLNLISLGELYALPHNVCFLTLKISLLPACVRTIARVSAYRCPKDFQAFRITAYVCILWLNPVIVLFGFLIFLHRVFLLSIIALNSLHVFSMDFTRQIYRISLTSIGSFSAIRFALLEWSYRLPDNRSRDNLDQPAVHGDVFDRDRFFFGLVNCQVNNRFSHWILCIAHSRAWSVLSSLSGTPGRPFALDAAKPMLCVLRPEFAAAILTPDHWKDVLFAQTLL